MIRYTIIFGLLLSWADFGAQAQTFFWQPGPVFSSIYVQLRSIDTKKANDPPTEKSVIFDTYTIGKLGGSNYFAAIEGTMGHINYSGQDSHSSFGKDLLKLQAFIIQTWQISEYFSGGWNGYAINRNLSRSDQGLFGYTFYSIGGVLKHQKNGWTFAPKINYIFSGSLGKDGLAGHSKSNFTGYHFVPLIRKDFLFHNTVLTISPVYLNVTGDNKTAAEYLKLTISLAFPFNNKWWIASKVSYQHLYKFDYFGIDIANENETRFILGLRYRW